MTRRSRTAKTAARNDPAVAAQVSPQRLEGAIVYVAECVVALGSAYGPFLEKLERELAAMQAQADPRARAIAIIAAAKAKSGA